MDNFYTILLYVGALLLIGLVKSISGAGKKKPAVATNRSFSTVEEEKTEASFDFNSMLDFLQENPVLPKTETKPPKIKKPLPVLPIQNEEDRVIMKSADMSVTLAEKEASFIFGDFDLPAAVVYSEILKRPNY
jgi:hypothetical protein